MKHAFLFTLLVCSFTLSSCKKNKMKINTKGGELSLLAKPNSIGMIEGFNIENSQATNDSIIECWNEALNAGMSVARLQIDWPSIETSEGVYDKEFFESRIKLAAEDGLATFVLISAYDSEGPDVPDYLKGVEFDDAKMIESFKKLMDWVVPVLAANNGYAISVSNEPDNSFQDNKKLWKQIRNFFIPVRDHIHAINESIGVSITLNTGNLEFNKNTMKKLMVEFDFGCFNLYGSGLFPLDIPYTAEEIESNIQEMMDFAGEKNIIIQELGTHSNSEILNSSESIQRDFFKTFFTRMEQEDRIKAAYVFQLVDWSPETTKIITSSLDGEVPSYFTEQYGLTLQSIGLIDYKTGT
ncbi:MAG: hypothetical protein AB8B74_14945 [Crocinitomicaceae bacterium]